MNKERIDFTCALKKILEASKKHPLYCCCEPKSKKNNPDEEKPQEDDPTIKAETIKIGKTITGKPGTDAMVVDTTGAPDHVLDFTIPEGKPGECPDTIPYHIKSAYLVTFSNNEPTGIEVLENERIPISRKELDTGEICDLDVEENTFQFNKPGYYKISFKIHAALSDLVTGYDPAETFISVGLRLVGTDDIFIGDSYFMHPKHTETLIGEGIITVNSIANPYELVNLTKSTIYLKSPDIENINTKSYFSNAPVTIMVEYLGNHIKKT